MNSAPLDARAVVHVADELEQLMRAGLPLGNGLRSASAGWTRRTSSVSGRLAQLLDQGLSLPEALDRCPEFPRVFRSILQSGVPTSATADLLRAYSTSTRTMINLRESLTRGLTYPATIVVVAFILSIVLVLRFFPEVDRAFESLGIAPPVWLRLAQQARATIGIWGWGIPALATALWIGFRLWPRFSGNRIDLLRLAPRGGALLREMNMACASRFLAVLMECRIPLPSALVMSSEFFDLPAAQRQLMTAAAALQAGAPLKEAVAGLSALPPLWRGMLVDDAETGRLVADFRQIADVYQFRAATRAEILARMVPAAAVVVIGGLVTLIYASALFVPLSQLWMHLGGGG